MGSAFELQIVRRDIPSKALKRGKEHMSAKNPKKIKLIAVDGTKSTEELKTATAGGIGKCRYSGPADRQRAY